MKTRIFLLWLLLAWACNNVKNTTQENEPPKQSKEPVVITKAQPVALTPESVKEFVLWASGSGLDEQEKVREAIQKAAHDDVVLKLLFQEYDSVEINDVGYSLIVLSIIGELKNPTSIPQLVAIINQELPAIDSAVHSGLSNRDYAEILASKAVECLAYLRTPEANQLTLKVIAEHNSSAVRSAAIDAYLFNNGDSREAKDRLRKIVKEEDKPLIDRVRFKRTGDAASFNAELNRFYELNPKEVAENPGEPSQKLKLSDSSNMENPVTPPKRKQK